MKSVAAPPSLPLQRHDLPMSPSTTRRFVTLARLWRYAAFEQVEAAPHSRLDSTPYGACKMALEWVFAAVLLILAAPVILLAGLLVKLTSRGSVFYSQTRVGKNGRLFTLYKIRTMANNCEKESGAIWASANDPRITRVGAFLRKTHLDELPQLFNVLRCEMSLVGPRPERPEFVPSLERAIPLYAERLLVRPGVTGVAQVQLPPDTDLASVRRKLAYDLYYVRHAGLWLDLRLILCTAIHILGVPFHVVGRLFLLPKLNVVETAYYQRTQPPDSLPEVMHGVVG